MGGTPATAGSGIQVPASVSEALPGYKISVFAKIPGSLQPDDLLLHGNNVYVLAQDPNNNPDGTVVAGTSPQSQIIEYDPNGNVLKTINVPGHPDGIAEYDANTIWLTSNEDANPVLTVINTATGTQQTFTPDALTAHGGGLDDLKVVNGAVYVSGGNPTLTSTSANAPKGVNANPAVYSMTLNPGNKTFHLTPVLMGEATATNVVTGAQVTLNMIDPDSNAIAPNGDFVQDNQAGSQLVFIHNPGPNQSVSVLPLTAYGNPSPVDDTRWAPSGNSFMLLSDNATQLIYRIDATAGFTAGTAYSAGKGMVLQDNISTGVMTPVFTGMGNPHGLIFVGQ